MMSNAGIAEPQLMHFGNEKSRNDFDGETVGLVLGSIDPGDDEILDWLAVLGLEAEPKMEITEDGKASRAYGREFIGPDSDAATEFLEAVRELRVAQAAGRYARNARDMDSRATVFIWTGAIPPELVDAEAPGIIRYITPLKQEIESAIQSSTDSVTARELAERIGCTKKHALEVLNDLAAQGVVSKSEGTGPYGAHEFRYIDGNLGPVVDLEFSVNDET